jgi:PAS domain S-box-containing protein
MNPVTWVFNKNFLPHEYCYRQNPALIGLHFSSDLLIGAAYFAISLTLVYFVWRGRRQIPFHWMFLAFGTFIIACGATHLMEVWTLWVPVYWLAGLVKAVTAAASVGTAMALPPLVPRALDLVRSARISDQRQAELEATIAAFENEIEERRRAEEEVRRLAAELEVRVQERTSELARANELLAEKAAIVEPSSDAIFSITFDRIVTSWNSGAERVYGYSASEMIGRSAEILLADGQLEPAKQMIQRIRAGEKIEPFETVRVRKDGRHIDVSVTVSAVKDHTGAPRGVSIVARDITERKRAEEELRHLQKLESLGVIAGGVAHDFNNLLAGILTNASLALEAIPREDPNHELIAQVVAAGEKAGHLTTQLLAYAGKGRFVLKRLDVSELVQGISRLIRTSVPKTVELQLNLAPGLPEVEGDPGQLEQVVMNLIINGAEAIGPERQGLVRVTTSQIGSGGACLQQNLAGDRLKPGSYVSIEVSDTGSGIDESVKRHIFDPFFTTKFTGRGLGLSAVMGIVRSHHGVIQVESHPGHGSTFRILLPPAPISAPASPPVSAMDEWKGSGLILVVDDEEQVRTAARAVLTRYGYTVMIAEDGQAGVNAFRERAAEIKAVLLDMTMPVMRGEEALRQIRAIKPDAPVVLTSGYNDAEAIRRLGEFGVSGFLQKPYKAAELARAIKKAAS